jgi:CelD/BcsL family acetyltransferase involved in cellulose biosynthesis
MNIAARPKSAGRLPRERASGTGGTTVRLALFDNFAAAEPLWRRLEAMQPFASPYQRYEWVSHWFAHVGQARGDTPLLVAGLDDDGAPLFMLPFVSVRRFGCDIVRFSGGSHANLNLPVWRSGLSGAAGLLADIAAEHAVDLFALNGQPLSWQGEPNPFAALPRQPSPDDVYNGSFESGGPSGGPASTPRLPSGMRKKERKLMRLDGFRYAMAATADEVETILTAFHAQKAVRFSRQGIRNIFADPAVVAFIHDACLDGLSAARPAIELHTLTGDGEILAIVGGASNSQRFSVMFNSITDSTRARLSPGIILMSHIIADCRRRGIASYDLGAGHAPYKAYFSSGSEQRFDCFIPFTARGAALASAYRGSGALRHSIKSNPTLMNALHAIRRWTSFGRQPNA